MEGATSEQHWSNIHCIGKCIDQVMLFIHLASHYLHIWQSMMTATDNTDTNDDPQRRQNSWGPQVLSICCALLSHWLSKCLLNWSKRRLALNQMSNSSDVYIHTKLHKKWEIGMRPAIDVRRAQRERELEILFACFVWNHS